MSDLVNVGFGNIVNMDRVIAIVSSDSAPAKRTVKNARLQGLAIDATHGRKAKAVIVMENSQIVLSALAPETLYQRAARQPDPPGQNDP